MTLKGKLSSFIFACNKLRIFIFNHQDINVKFLVKNLLGGGGEGKKKKKDIPGNPHRTFLLQFCVNLPKEPEFGVASAHCLGFPWAILPAYSLSQNLWSVLFS